MVTNSTNQVKKLSEYTPDELKAELKTAADNGDFGRVQEISKELLNIGKKEHAKVEFNEKQKEMLEKIANKTATPDEVKDFVENDLKEYKGDTDQRMKNIEEFKDKKIEDLEKQLQEKDTVIDTDKGALSTLPSVLDLVSPKTRKVIRVFRKIHDMEKQDVPVKNLLIYCMTVAQGSFLSQTRGWLKRGRVKAMIKGKDASIVQSDELKKIKTMLAPDPSKKSEYRELLKELLLKTITKQQEKYAKEVSKKITG